MQSKTLCFNRTLFRKNLSRFWPLWAVPSFVGALFPLAMLTHLIRYGLSGMFGNGTGNYYTLQFTDMYYQVVKQLLPALSLGYAILVAMAVWSYLFNNRSTGLMHTLPIRRESLFLTNFLSGMTMMLVPYVVTGALCVVISLAYGVFDPVGLAVTVLCVLGESLFYFASATAAVFVTGNLIALPVLYFIFHFLVAGLDVLISTFSAGFIFGLSETYTGKVEFLSPTVYLMTHVKIDRGHEEIFVPTEYGTLTAEGKGHYESILTSVKLENAWVIAVYALLGVVLLAVAYALYRRRRSESAGDVVAVGWMKPVFRYGVSFCGALLGGLGLYYVFWGNFQTGEFYDVLPLVLCMVLAGAIGYYAASMLLAKSLRVFRGSWKGLAAVALCCVAVCGVLKFDLLGIETRVPSMDQIESVTFRAGGNQYTLNPEEDPDLVAEIRAVHRAIAEDADYIVDLDERWNRMDAAYEDVSMHNYIRLNYQLKSGASMERYYSIPISAQRLEQGTTYDFMLDQLLNSDAMKAERFHIDDTLRPDSGYIYREASPRDSISFGTREAQVIHEAVKKDIAAGTCGNYDWFGKNQGKQYAIDLSLEFRESETIYGGDTYVTYDNISVMVYPEMTHTVEALLELNLVKPSDLKTYAELYPQDYDAKYQEYQKTYGYVDYDVYLDVRYGEAIDLPATSVGIIGGADGPTAIYVTED